HAEAPEAQTSAVLRLRRNLERHAAALRRRDLDLAPKQRDLHGHRHDVGQVLALALEAPVRLDLDARPEPGRTEHGAMRYAGWDLDLDAPAVGQLEAARSAAYHLLQGHADDPLSLRRSGPGRAEDVGEAAPPAEQVIEVDVADGLVRDSGTGGPMGLSRTGGARVDARRLRRAPVATEGVIELPLLGVREPVVR